MNGDADRTQQNLEQERLAFEQKLKQDATWFYLRVTMGVVAVLSLVGVLVGAGYVVLSQDYSGNVTGAAVAFIFSDLAGLFVGVWQIVMKGAPTKPLEPMTKAPLDPDV